MNIIKTIDLICKKRYTVYRQVSFLFVFKIVLMYKRSLIYHLLICLIISIELFERSKNLNIEY